MKECLLSSLRSKTSSMKEFRSSAKKLAAILAIETAATLPFDKTTIETPIETTTGKGLSCPIVLVAVLRSGVALLPSFMQFYEGAEVGFLGISRNEETAHPTLYYEKIPRISHDTYILILEPMIATGGSALITLHKMLALGADIHKMRIISFICATQGVQKIHSHYPEVQIITASKPENLNSQFFIAPGLGDFGDRFFGN